MKLLRNLSRAGLAMSLLLGAACGADDITAVDAVSAPSLSVSSYSDVVSVKITAPSTSVAVGDTLRLSVTARDRQGDVVTGLPLSWSSGNTSRATVSSAGVVTGHSTGGVSIKVTTQAKSTYFYVTVVAARTAAGPADSSTSSPSSGPTASTSDIPVQVARFDGGSSEVLVSSGVPLAPGALRPGQTGRVRLVIGGTERRIAVTELAGRHRDGSLRAILVQTRLTFGARERPTGRLTLTSERPSAFTLTRVAAPSVPSAAVLPSDPAYLVATDLVGPTITVAQSKALGTTFTRYETDFARYADQHWSSEGDSWKGNYYDRALVYYAFWVRTANPEYWRRATRIARAYRRDYLEKNAYGSSPHWAQLEGLEKHYLLTGDEQSRHAIAQVAGGAFNYYVTRLDRVELSNFESRIQARVLQAYLLAWRLDARGTHGRDWGATLPSLLDQILSTQRSDGSYRFAYTCNQSLNYMTGMLNDVLVSYHDYYRADPRIPVAVKKSVDWLWSTQWVAGSRGFRYMSGSCSGVGGTGAAPDLNNLIVNGFAWTYRQTGDTRYRDRADQIFAGSVAKAYLPGSKQFNEAYTTSYRTLGFRMR